MLIDRSFLPDPALPNLIPGPRAQCCWSEHPLEMEGQAPGSVSPFTPPTIVLFKTSEAVFGSPDTQTLMGTFPSKLFFSEFLLLVQLLKTWLFFRECCSISSSVISPIPNSHLYPNLHTQIDQMDLSNNTFSYDLQTTQSMNCTDPLHYFLSQSSKHSPKHLHSEPPAWQPKLISL